MRKTITTKQPIENRIIPYDSESLIKYAELKEISFEQMENDLEEFCYILENCYAGLDAAKSNGLNIENEKNAIINLLKQKQTINISDFAEILYKRFSPYISDTHFSIEFSNNNYSIYYRFITQHRLYFSDLYVIKHDNNFYVYESTDETIKIGSIIQLVKINDYLYEYPAKGKNIYRLAVFSDKEESEIIIKIDDKDYNVPLYCEPSNNEAFTHYIKYSDKAAYIRYNRCCFDNDEQKEQLRSFSYSADKCRNKDVIIFDIRGNHGGADGYSLQFFADLYFNNKKKAQKFINKYRCSEKWIYSLASIKSAIYSFNKYCDMSLPEVKKGFDKFLKLEKRLSRKPQKLIETVSKSNYKFNKSSYNGEIIILTDKGVASSGESVLEQAYLFFKEKNQVIQIGTNTSGCASFGNLCTYHLSNSGLQITCGFTDFSVDVTKLNKFKGEGKGYFPDYWCTVNDLEKTISAVLNVNIEEVKFNA